MNETTPSPDPASGFRIVSESLIRTGPVVDTWLTIVETPDGSRVEREVARHPGAVAVVPVDGDDIIMVRQYRAPIDGLLLEIPAGRIDPVDGAPEDPAVAARRELIEETGFDCERLDHLGGFLNTAFCDEFTHLWLARDLSPAPRTFDGPEEQFMEIVRHRIADIPGMIADGTIIDAKTLIGLQWALPLLHT